MDTIPEVPWYLSTVTELPADDAPKVFDRWMVGASPSGGEATLVTVSDGELVVDERSLERYTKPGLAHPYRRLHGRLRFRNPFVRDIGIELELAPWSQARTELAIRKGGRRGIGDRQGQRFGALGSEVLGILAESLAWYRARGDEFDERVTIAA